MRKEFGRWLFVYITFNSIAIRGDQTDFNIRPVPTDHEIALEYARLSYLVSYFIIAIFLMVVNPMMWIVAWIDGFISLNLAVSLPFHSIVHTCVCNKFKSPLVFAVCMMILLFTLGSLQKGEKIGPLIQLFIQNINPPLIFSIFNITCIFTVLLFGIAHSSKKACGAVKALKQNGCSKFEGFRKAATFRFSASSHSSFAI